MHFNTPISTLLLTLPLTFAHPTAEKLAPRLVGGWCGLHITQHQKNEDGVGGDYQYDLRIYDAIQEEIGGVNALDIPNLQTRGVDSQLPYVIEITSGEIDPDPIAFAYGGQSWTTDAGQCSIGSYNNGARQGDCGFTC